MGFLTAVIIVFVGISFISSQEEAIILTEVTDIGKIIGLPEGEIIGQGVKYQLIEENTRLTFINENANVNLKGNSFKNIIPQDTAGHPTFIDIGETGNIARADFTVNEEGGTYVFGNTEINAPPNSRVFFDKATGVRIKIPEDGELKEIPKAKDSFLPSDYITTIEGKDIKLPSNEIINGKLRYDNGQAFVSLEDKTIINGVELTGEAGKEEVANLFFDGRRHEGDYVSFDLENKKMIIASDIIGPIANFKEGNPFIKIDEGDYVAMQVFGGGEIEIKNRDSQGLIPRVITKGEFVIDEDYKSILRFKSYNKVYIEKEPRLFDINKEITESTTSPIELFTQNTDGLNLLKEKNKIFVDNFNRIAIGLDNEEFISLSEGIDTTFSSRIHYNYPTEESMEALTGKGIRFVDVSQGNKDLVLGRLRDYWETLTPETRDSIEYMEFYSDEEFNKKFKDKFSEGGFPVENTGAFVETDSGKIFFKAKKMRLSTSRHEAGHARHFAVNANTFKILEFIGIPNFESEWKDIVGKGFYRNEVPHKLFYPPKEEPLPKKGFVRYYGTLNIFEDVATFTDKVATNPCFFKDLISPEKQEYDERYAKKINLLHKYKFISTIEHNNVNSC